MKSCCLICFKDCEGNPHRSSSTSEVKMVGDENKRLTENQEVLKRFLRLLERHLMMSLSSYKMRKKKSSLPEIQDLLKCLEGLRTAGIGTCKDCLKLLQAFGDLFHKMKTIELLLNGKLWTLKNIMAAAAKVSLRVEHFKEIVGDSPFTEETGSSLENIIKLRKELVKICSNLLLNSHPKLSLPKCSILKQEVFQESSTQSFSTEATEPAKSSDKVLYSTYSTQPIPDSKPKRKSLQVKTSRKRKILIRYVSRKVRNSRLFLLRKYLSRIKAHTRLVKSKQVVQKISLKPPKLSKSVLLKSTKSETSCDPVIDENSFCLRKVRSLKTELKLASVENMALDEIVEDNHIFMDSFAEDNALPKAEIMTLPDSSVRKLRTVHKCKFCGKTFATENNLYRHQETEGCTPEQMPQKERENSAFKEEEGSMPHEFTYKDHINENEDEAFPSDSESTTTGTSDDDDVDNEDIVFQSTSSFVEANDKKGNWRCFICSDHFPTYRSVRNHKLVFHKVKSGRGSRTWACSKCELSFFTNKLLTLHKRSVHKKIKKEKGTDRKMHRFLCTNCNDKSFHHLYELLSHRKGDCIAITKNNNEDDPEGNDSEKITVKLIQSAYGTIPPSHVSHPCSVKTLTEVKEIATVKVSPNLFICPVPNCSRYFYSVEQLESHSMLHGSFECGFNCEVVKNYAPDLAVHGLEAHSRVKEKQRILPNYTYCPGCHKKFDRKLLYIDHFVKVHMLLPSFTIIEYCCGICKETYRDRKHLINHYITFHNLAAQPENVINCTVKNCSAYFLTKRQLACHVNSVHSNLDKNERSVALEFHCKDCDKPFTTKFLLRQHRLGRHVEKDKIIYCRIRKCHKMFETEMELEDHVNISHKEETMLDCAKCNKSFARFQDFQAHQKAHKRHETNQGKSAHKGFTCEQCGKSFKNKQTLSNHQLIHAGPESFKFECKVCFKRCINSTKLNEHLRTHTNEKPFVCQICGVKYAHRHNLRIHVNNKHGDVMQDIPRKMDKTNFTSRKGMKWKKKDVDTESMEESEECDSD